MSIEVIRPKSGKDKKYLQEIFVNSLQGNHLVSNGWSFNAGEPELHKYKDLLFNPNGKVLDLGMGAARVSLMFALNGMEVEGYDQNQFNVDTVNELAAAYDLPLSSTLADIRSIILQPESYDLVLLSSVFTHFPKKTDAFNVVSNAVNSLKKDGHIWVRTLGKEDGSYEAYTQEIGINWGGVKRVDEDVFLAPCACSGAMELENHLFMGQTELLQYFLQRELKIIHSNVGPKMNERNVMYGEDWPRFDTNKSGFISILAQK